MSAKKYPFEKPIDIHNIMKRIETAYENKQGIYSIVPEVPPDQIQLEVQVARQKFNLIAAQEKKRVEQVVEQENVRVMKLLKEKQADVACPFCLEDLLAIYSPEPVLNPLAKLHF